MQLKVLELFAGIGGAACSFEGLGEIAAAIDINQNAKLVYELNFRHPYLIRSIESLNFSEPGDFNVNTWWVSAPCQPFTRRGNQRDDLDPRSRALLHLTGLIGEAPPENFFLENVIGFQGSQTHQKLVKQLENCDYSLVEFECCPTQLGIPNRRPRYYLFATKSAHLHETDFPLTTASTRSKPLAEFLDEETPQRFELTQEDIEKYGDGMNFVSQDSTISNCFTSAYGRSLTKSGSYLNVGNGRVRRFSPTEISRLLGFHQPEFTNDFVFPESLNDRQLWKLLGNSISVFVVRKLLTSFKEILDSSGH